MPSDNLQRTVNKLLASGQAQPGEESVSTAARSLVDSAGNLVAQIGPNGLLTDAWGARIAALPRKKAICATKAWSGSGGVLLQFGTPSALNVTYRSRHTVTAGANNISVLFGNSAAETNGTTAYTIKASIEPAIGAALYPLTFGGAASALVNPGALVESDPLNGFFPAGSVFYIRVNYQGASACVITSYPAQDAGEAYYIGDATGGGAMTTAFGSFNYAPFAVYGEIAGSAPVIALVGDSIMLGYQSGNGDGTGYMQSYGLLALGSNQGASFSHVNLGIVGEQAGALAAWPGAYLQRARLLKGCTHAIDNYGINDVRGGATLAALQANAIAGWQNLFGSYGIKTWHCTLTPVTKDLTDDPGDNGGGTWYAAANQAIRGAGSYESVRLGFNSWLRDGAPLNPASLAPLPVGSAPGASCVRFGQAGHPAFGFFDAADQAETARNSGIWKSNFTKDGIHPAGSTAGSANAILANAINPALFV